MENMTKEEIILFLEELSKESKKDNVDKIIVGTVIKEDNKVLLLKRPINEFMGVVFIILKY
jgi:8-oxo-dGTP diphosphatase